MTLPLANGRYRRPAQIVSRVLAVSALVVWIFHILLSLQYNATRPQSPDAESGRVIVQNQHGHYVYLTPAEQKRLTGTDILAVGLFLAGMLTVGLFDGFPERRRARPWEIRRW
jgi:hypothetical protein